MLADCEGMVLDRVFLLGTADRFINRYRHPLLLRGMSTAFFLCPYICLHAGGVNLWFIRVVYFFIFSLQQAYLSSAIPFYPAGTRMEATHFNGHAIGRSCSFWWKIRPKVGSNILVLWQKNVTKCSAHTVGTNKRKLLIRVNIMRTSKSKGDHRFDTLKMLVRFTKLAVSWSEEARPIEAYVSSVFFTSKLRRQIMSCI